MNKNNEFRNENNVMKGVGKTFLTALAFLMLAFLTQSVVAQEQKTETKPETKTEAKPEVKAEAPKILAVEFYADWCAVCKELMPRMADVRKSYQNKQILVVRFDMTDDYTKAQASFMASYSGLGEVYQKGGGRTGFIALVDVKTKEILGVINKKKTNEEIVKLIDETIVKATSTK